MWLSHRLSPRLLASLECWLVNSMQRHHAFTQLAPLMCCPTLPTCRAAPPASATRACLCLLSPVAVIWWPPPTCHALRLAPAACLLRQVRWQQAVVCWHWQALLSLWVVVHLHAKVVLVLFSRIIYHCLRPNPFNPGLQLTPPIPNATSPATPADPYSDQPYSAAQYTRHHFLSHRPDTGRQPSDRPAVLWQHCGRWPQQWCDLRPRQSAGPVGHCQAGRHRGHQEQRRQVLCLQADGRDQEAAVALNPVACVRGSASTRSD